jgi:chromosomal replication initiator protein
MSEIRDHGKVWEDCLRYISHRIKKQSFATWLRHTTGASDGNGGMQINVPNEFVAEWIQEHYSDLIDESLRLSCGQPIGFSFHINKDDKKQTELEFIASPPAPAVPRPVVPHRLRAGMLNSRYTFENLVVGNFNQFACAAADAVAKAPGLTRYNPLYIYGGVGLGKTHLLQAIGHHIMQDDPTKKVIYATSEKFTSDFINSISSNTTTDFVNQYRSVDALLIDDTQFFTGKESTQEQFFHTFNTLYNVGKQIVLTSDRAPRDIKGMEERLLSRFSWGLVTDIQAPDLETRMAILQRKMELENIEICEDVVAFLADTITTNIRELEGSLTSLLAHASLQKQEITLEMARRVLSDTLRTKRRSVSIDQIKKQVAEVFHVEVEMLSAKKKTQTIALARQVAMYLARTLTNTSLQATGDAFGGRDHSTVIHAEKLIRRLMAEDPELAEKIKTIIRNLSGGS